MRILIVEDEAPLRQQLVAQLNDTGFAVDETPDGKEALYFGSENDYDVAVIDLGLPELSGLELIKQLRAKHKSYPILILTARDHWQDKVTGLEAGADDYLTKPFHMPELIARIKALTRRKAGVSQTQLNFGPLLINTNQKSVHVNDQEITLTQFEYNTLEYLAFHADKVISKTELTEHLYQQDFDRDSNVIEVFIRRLRKKLDPNNTLNPIDTIRGQGYRFSLKPSKKS